MRKSILTIASDYWSIRKIMEQFKCPYRMTKQSKDLENSGGVLTVPPFKKQFQKLLTYENDTNGRIKKKWSK